MTNMREVIMGVELCVKENAIMILYMYVVI